MAKAQTIQPTSQILKTVENYASTSQQENWHILQNQLWSDCLSIQDTVPFKATYMETLWTQKATAGMHGEN